MTYYTSIAEVTKAVDAGLIVYWKHEGYVVTKDRHGTYHITFTDNGHTVGLFWTDGVTTDYKGEEFFTPKSSRWNVSVYDGYSTNSFVREGSYDYVSNSCKMYPPGYIVSITPAEKVDSSI